jgi:hypothetical protein
MISFLKCGELMEDSEQFLASQNNKFNHVSYLIPTHVKSYIFLTCSKSELQGNRIYSTSSYFASFDIYI